MKKYALFAFFFLFTSSFAFADETVCRLGQECKYTTTDMIYNISPSDGSSFTCEIWDLKDWLIGKVYADQDFYFTPISLDLVSGDHVTVNIKGRYFQGAEKGKIRFHQTILANALVKCDTVE